MSDIEIRVGDCRDVLPEFEGQIDAIVTDPPYGLGFMGKTWDTPAACAHPKRRDGSGSPLVAARQEGFRGVGIELSEHYAAIARERLERVQRKGFDR